MARVDDLADRATHHWLSNLSRLRIRFCGIHSTTHVWVKRKVKNAQEHLALARFLVSASPSARNYPGWVRLPVESLTRSGGSSFQSLRPPLLCEADANWRVRNSMWSGRGPAAAKLSYSRVKGRR